MPRRGQVRWKRWPAALPAETPQRGVGLCRTNMEPFIAGVAVSCLPAHYLAAPRLDMRESISILSSAAIKKGNWSLFIGACSTAWHAD